MFLKSTAFPKPLKIPSNVKAIELNGWARITIQNIFSKISITFSFELNTLPINGYKRQDVIIGAFMCAYLGETPTLNNINPLKQRIPLPNWRITFDGIGKIKSLRKYIKKLSFTHAYRSNFSLGNYTTNLSGDWDAAGNATQTDIAGNFISQKQIMTMNILEPRKGAIIYSY